MKTSLITFVAVFALARLTQAAPAPAGSEADKEVLREAQANVLDMAKAMMEKVEDPKSQAALGAAIAEMERSVKFLEEAKGSPEKLPSALAAQQAAYKRLLELAAHVYQVSRQNQKSQQKGKQGNSRERQFEQMLEQMEMKKQEDRYEKQSQASPMQNEEQKEQLAVLNRLKELAQRQNDINERLKELQNALEAAKTEEQKEEARRQLKRLQEEQQQMLADIDEVKQRMEQGENQSRMADERRQLDQTRQQAEKAAQSLEQNKASEALAAGSRAQRELEQMRDDFRKKTSKAFSEEMRQMRDDARELAKNQQELGKQLETLNQENTKKRSLADTDQRTQVTQKLDQQRNDLDKVTENMRRVSEAAEAAEPLLARELYDTLRKSAQSDTGQNLQMTQELLNRGYVKQAVPFEQKAQKEINDIRDGVERAAKGVLGDEAEALRTARSELDALNEQLSREIARNSPALAEQMRQDAQQREAREAQRAQAGGQQGQGQEREPRAMSATELAGAQQRQEQLQQTAQELSRAVGSENPELARTRAEIERLRQQLAEQRAQATQGQQAGQPRDGSQTNATASASQGSQTNAQARAGQGQQSGQQASQKGQRPGQQGRPSQSGQQRGEQPGQLAQAGQQPGEQSGQQPGQQSREGQQAQQGQQADQQPGQQRGGQNQQPGQQPGQQASSQRGQGQPQEGRGEQAGEQQAQANADGRGGGQRNRANNLLDLGQRNRGVTNMEGGGYGNTGMVDVIRGEGYLQWSDRLRSVEEMLDRPELRVEAARIREITKGMRAEFKRHSKEPQWDIVQSKISAPLAELRNRVSEELARLESKDSLVPIDRDPVPGKFGELVRRYYEELGREK